MRGAVFIMVVAACGSSSHAPATIDAPTDTTVDALDAAPQNPALEIMYRGSDGSANACAPNAAIPLIAPPQGGFVLLPSARVKHFDLATLMLTASLRDAVDNHVVTVEQRPVTLVAGADGWAEPDHPMDLINWANLATCPAQMSTRDLDAQAYVLRVAVADGAGATGAQELTIVPTCAAGADGDLCRCQCKLGYKLGDPCP